MSRSFIHMLSRRHLIRSHGSFPGTCRNVSRICFSPTSSACRNYCATKRQVSRLVRPGNVSPTRLVPAQIPRPPYVERTLIPFVSDENVQLRKSVEQISGMRKACQVGRNVLDFVASYVKPGVTTDDLDRLAHEECIRRGAYPSPLLYKNFPKSICTSVNNVACHGVPDDCYLAAGDIINIDVTVACRCRDDAIRVCGPGRRLADIGNCIESVAADLGVEVVAAFCGHGIGEHFHMPPDIFHVANNLPGTMEEGMTFTIEPVISEGSGNVYILDDGWTAVTEDNSRTAQFEHTILITAHGSEVLTER